MTSRQVPVLILSLLFHTQPSSAITPELGNRTTSCSTDRDCPPGRVCDIEFVACSTNPQSSECVRKICVAGTSSDLQHNDDQEIYIAMENGANHAQALCIQLFWPATDKTVWSVLRGSGLCGALLGKRSIRSTIHVCSGGNARSQECETHSGHVMIAKPISNKIGEAIEGNLHYIYPASGRKVTLPFKSELRMEYKTGSTCGNHPRNIHREDPTK